MGAEGENDSDRVRLSWEPCVRNIWVSIFTVPRATHSKTMLAFLTKAEVYSWVYFVFSQAIKAQTSLTRHILEVKYSKN